MEICDIKHYKYLWVHEYTLLAQQLYKYYYGDLRSVKERAGNRNEESRSLFVEMKRVKIYKIFSIILLVKLLSFVL